MRVATSDSQRRERALELALELIRTTTDDYAMGPELVLDYAQKFDAFLKGDE